MQPVSEAMVDTVATQVAGLAEAGWPGLSGVDVTVRLADAIGSPLICLDVQTGCQVSQSHPTTLAFVPPAFLLRLRDIVEAEVIPLSQGLLAFAGPVPGLPNRHLRFAGVALTEKGARPDELVLAATAAGWTSERLSLWLSELPVVSSRVLRRLVRLAIDQERLNARLQSNARELEALSRQIDLAYKQVSLLHSLAPHLQVSSGPEDLARVCLQRLEPLLPAQGHLIVLNGLNEEPALLLTRGSLPFAETNVLRLLQRFETHDWRHPLVRNCFNAAELGPEYSQLQNLLAVSIGTGESSRGWIVSCNEREGRGFGAVESRLLSSLATVMTTHLSNVQLYWENDDLLLSFVKSLVSTLDARDPYTRGHSERVALIARCLARRLALDSDDQETIYMSGLLHDIGKLGIDDRILRKPGNLTPEEYQSVQQHPALGCQILSPLRNLQKVLPGVRSHHETWEGAGYPDGLKGEGIPLMARIVAVADAYDAMNSNRPYRSGMPIESLERILRDGSGRHWDPQIVEAYFAERAEILRICATYQSDAGNLLRDRPAPRSAIMAPTVLRQ